MKHYEHKRDALRAAKRDGLYYANGPRLDGLWYVGTQEELEARGMRPLMQRSWEYRVSPDTARIDARLRRLR